ncbi:MAG: hypothetical protein GXO74_05985 [Calditrichaeota bacterium]|nr:hypothetical protein [Calditrichota bacterium]
MAEQHKIVLRRVGEKSDIIKIQFTATVPTDIADSYLAAAFGKCFKNKFYKIILDMKHIDEPNYRFIATVIEATTKVRSRNGDVKLINVSDAANHTINSFNAYTYLTIDEKKKNK